MLIQNLESSAIECHQTGYRMKRTCGPIIYVQHLDSSWRDSLATARLLRQNEFAFYLNVDSHGPGTVGWYRVAWGTAFRTRSWSLLRVTLDVP